MAHSTKFTHPFLLFIANQLLQRYTTAYTQSRITRSLVLLLSIFLSYTAIYHWNHHINTTGGAGRFLAGALFTTPNLILDRLIIRNWQYDATDLKPKLFAEKKKENEEMLTRLEWAGEVGTSLRYIDTPYEVSNVPFFGFGDPVLGPEKRVFILQHAGIIVALYFLNTLAIDGQLRANQEFLNDSYIPWFGRMFGGDISHFREELSTRVTVSLLYWVAQFCILQSLFSVGALLDVGLGGGEVRLWRPMFGEWRHACTMRGFWGKFWHQGIQYNVKGPAEFITHSILRVPPSTLLARYMKIYLAFAVSGAMHIVADYGGNVSPEQSGAMDFFCTQALGIMIEDGVQEIWRLMGGRKNTLFTRSVGFVWTIGFICWSSPIWVYPVARGMRREDMMLTPRAMKPWKFW